MPPTVTRRPLINRMTMLRTATRRTIITTTTIIAPRTATAIIITTSIVVMTTPAALMLMKTNELSGGGQEEPREVAVANEATASGSSSLSEGEAAALYRLMTWLSPSFPVGAFSYSSGIEWAVEAGDVTDALTLRHWLASMLTDGAGLCDSIFLAHAHRAASSGDDAMLAEIAELASAFATSRERHLETTAQGRAFIEIARAAWNSAPLDRLIAACESSIVYPVAVGLVSAAHLVPLAPTIHSFLHAVVSNWISAGARLIPLGQTGSQRVLAELEPVVSVTAQRALHASLDDLGSATFRADIASMRHEMQYTRLFRS
jgi:urease accessory protein